MNDDEPGSGQLSVPKTMSVERLIGTLLRAGVGMAATCCLCGGAVYLLSTGSHPVDYGQFNGTDLRFTSPPAIFAHWLDRSGRGLIQLSALLLIATPVARVALSLVFFTARRDPAYVAISAAVLAILLASLTGSLT